MGIFVGIWGFKWFNLSSDEIRPRTVWLLDAGALGLFIRPRPAEAGANWITIRILTALGETD